MNCMTPTRTTQVQQVLQRIDAAGPDGLTWREIADDMHIEHGTTSSALSNLDTAGRIVRLRRRRGRSSVYVLPQYAGPDDIAPRRVSGAGRSAWERGYGSGMAAGVTQGIEEGQAKGWTSGYDEGVEAGRRAALAEARETATALSQEQVERANAAIRANTNALVVIGSMLNAVDANNSLITHRGACWRQHPACALRAVRRALV